MACGVHVEEHMADDLKSEPCHVSVKVMNFSGPPLRHRLLRVPHHDLGVVADAPTVEGRLHQVSLPAPQVSLTGQQPVAQEAFVAHQRQAMDEVVASSYQNFFD